LLLLLDGEHGVLANLGCGITDSVGVLDRDEVLVRCADLCSFIASKHLVNTFFAEQVLFEFVRAWTSASRRSCVHPFEFFDFLFSSLGFLKSLQLLKLAFFLKLLPKLVELLLFCESFLLLEPHPLLILHQERMPRLFHVQVAATHVD